MGMDTDVKQWVEGDTNAVVLRSLSMGEDHEIDIYELIQFGTDHGNYGYRCSCGSRDVGFSDLVFAAEAALALHDGCDF